MLLSQEMKSVLSAGSCQREPFPQCAIRDGTGYQARGERNPQIGFTKPEIGYRRLCFLATFCFYNFLPTQCGEERKYVMQDMRLFTLENIK